MAYDYSLNKIQLLRNIVQLIGRTLLIITLLLANYSAAASIKKENQFYLGGGMGSGGLPYLEASGEIELDNEDNSVKIFLKLPNTKIFNIEFGYNLNSHISVELFGMLQQKLGLPIKFFKDNDQHNFRIQGSTKILGANFIYRFRNQETTLRPYFALGVGVNNLIIDEFESKNIRGVNLHIKKMDAFCPMGKIALGVTYQMADNLMLNFAVKTYITVTDIPQITSYGVSEEEFVDFTKILGESEFLSVVVVETAIGVIYQLPF